MMLICVFATGCATTSPMSGADLSRVSIPGHCEGLAERVSGPPWRKGANAKVLLAQTTVALDTANGRLDATRRCQASQRELLGR